MRIGHGYDAHRREYGKPLVLGGVKIKSDFGLMAHSDGDVLLHALADAILGAAGLRDIGFFYPDSSDETAGMSSSLILEGAARMAAERGFTLSYADCTVIAQKPKLSPYIEEIKTSIAEILLVPQDRVNVKATTEEGMGFTGRGEGISAHAVVLLEE